MALELRPWSRCVAYALIKLYEASGQQRFNIAGLELAERELTDIDRIGRNSSVGAPDHAGAAASQLAWCHGKPGVALALKVASKGVTSARSTRP
jgi:lantibiotic modifying enzyme